jgi:hypothetical protein
MIALHYRVSRQSKQRRLTCYSHEGSIPNGKDSSRAKENKWYGRLGLQVLGQRDHHEGVISGRRYPILPSKVTDPHADLAPLQMQQMPVGISTSLSHRIENEAKPRGYEERYSFSQTKQRKCIRRKTFSRSRESRIRVPYKIVVQLPLNATGPPTVSFHRSASPFAPRDPAVPRELKGFCSSAATARSFRAHAVTLWHRCSPGTAPQTMHQSLSG